MDHASAPGLGGALGCRNSSRAASARARRGVQPALQAAARRSPPGQAGKVQRTRARRSGERSAARGALRARRRPWLFMQSGSRPGHRLQRGRQRQGSSAGACVSGGREAKRVFVSFHSGRKKPETSKKKKKKNKNKKIPGDGGWVSATSGLHVVGVGVGDPESEGGVGSVVTLLRKEWPGRPGVSPHTGEGGAWEVQTTIVSWGRKSADVDSDRPAGWSCSPSRPPNPELRK